MSIYGNSIMMGGGGGSGSGDVPLLTRTAWNALSTTQKKAYGLVAIQDDESGFDIGELVYGADYTDNPTLINVQFINGADMRTVLSYSFAVSGSYTVIISTLHGKNIGGLSIQLNGNDIAASFVSCASNASPTLVVYAAELTVNSGDVISVFNSSATAHTGVQLFVFRAVVIADITLVGCASNDNSTFSIPQSLTAWYFEVAKYGYYNGNNTIPETSVFQCLSASGTSTPCPNVNNYWYGGTYVITIK